MAGWPAQYERLPTRNVRAMLLLALETGPAPWVVALAMETNSDQDSESYAWLSAPPAMNEFIGKRKLNELVENGFAIRNKDFENNVVFKSKDMRRDKTGQIQIRINQLAERADDLWAILLSNLIIAGESTVCYDGQYFFDTDHTEGQSGTISNDITYDVATTTDPTFEELSKAIMAAIQAMFAFKDDQGQPINQNASKFVVMVPTPFMGAAYMAVTALLGTGGISALLPALKGRFDIEVVVNPRLTWTTKFAVFRADANVKPFILQRDEGGNDVVAIGDGSEHEQLHKEQIFGVDRSGNVGYGYWQGACLVTLI